jgi:hypothetical protein
MCPQADASPERQFIDTSTRGRCSRPVRQAESVVKRKTEVSIGASEPPAIGAAETVDTGKTAIVPAVAFIIVEIVLVVETISVILMKEIDPRNPGAALIAILLSMALLANLGVVCGIAAARAAESVRQSKRRVAYAVSDWSGVVRTSG